MNSHPTDLLPAHALGILEEEDRQVAEHLALCPSCRAELATYEGVVGQLALAAVEAVPPPRVKQHLMQSIQQPRPSTRELSGATWWQRLTSLWGKVGPVWGVASLVLIVALVTTNLWLWQRAGGSPRMVTPGGMQIVALAGTSAVPEATGTLVISDDGRYGTLVVDGLPVLDPDHQYQLWLIRDGQRTSGGVFSVNAEGYGSLWIESQEPLASFPSFGISIEPGGGSFSPTGDKVLEGHL